MTSFYLDHLADLSYFFNEYKLYVDLIDRKHKN